MVDLVLRGSCERVNSIENDRNVEESVSLHVKMMQPHQSGFFIHLPSIRVGERSRRVQTAHRKLSKVISIEESIVDQNHIDSYFSHQCWSR